MNFIYFLFPFVSDYVAIGPRFSNTVLQTLLVLLKKKLRKVCDLFISTSIRVWSFVKLSKTIIINKYQTFISALIK